MTGLTPIADRRDDRRHSARSTPAVTGMQAIHLRASVPPAVVIAVVGAGFIAFVLARGASATTVRLVIAAAVAGVLLALLAAAYAANAATRQVYRQVRAVRSAAMRGQADLQQLVGDIQRGEQPVPRIPAPAHVAHSDPFRLLTHDLEQSQYAAEQALLRIAARVPVGTADQRVEIFVNLARRMQSLVHREIELLDELEAKVEDPELLKGLFTVDHLATRMRRQSESLAVLGGASSRRQWTRQVTMHEVLRAAVAEVEQYSRVKVVPPVEGVLSGSAVSDVIHLIAELIENATKFSAPRTQALLRAQKVTAGLAIDVEDRGLGMVAADQQRMNTLLADPGQVNINELLRDGRIGLFVVSTLARRHGIKVQLQSNIYGGTQAVVVLPNVLLDGGEGQRELERADGEPGQTAAAPLPAASRASLPAQASRPPAHASGLAAPASGPSAPAFPAARLDEAGTGPLATSAGAAVPAVPATAAAFSPAPTAGERPPLPKRQIQANLAPELRDAPETRRAEPPAEQMTGLMAEFQRGISRSQEEDSPLRDDTTR
jgi:signal transduction histidine kinase